MNIVRSNLTVLRLLLLLLLIRSHFTEAEVLGARMEPPETRTTLVTDIGHGT